MSRKEFPRKVKRQALDRAAGKCENRACGAVLKTREGEVDHILPCELGGEPVLANAQVLCRVCHKAKTADDVRRIRKSDRSRDKDSGAIRPAQSIPGRGFARPDKPAKQAKTQPPRRPLFQEVTHD